VGARTVTSKIAAAGGEDVATIAAAEPALVAAPPTAREATPGVAALPRRVATPGVEVLPGRVAMPGVEARAEREATPGVAARAAAALVTEAHTGTLRAVQAEGTARSPLAALAWAVRPARLAAELPWARVPARRVRAADNEAVAPAVLVRVAPPAAALDSVKGRWAAGRWAAVEHGCRERRHLPARADVGGDDDDDEAAGQAWPLEPRQRPTAA